VEFWAVVASPTTTAMGQQLVTSIDVAVREILKLSKNNQQGVLRSYRDIMYEVFGVDHLQKG